MFMSHWVPVLVPWAEPTELDEDLRQERSCLLVNLGDRLHKRPIPRLPVGAGLQFISYNQRMYK